jgi:hypothetical protein
VREAGEGRFFLRLDKAPDGLVTVNVERYSGDEGISIQSGATRTFKASNWDQWQAIVLAAAGDENATAKTPSSGFRRRAWRISSDGHHAGRRHRRNLAWPRPQQPSRFEPPRIWSTAYTSSAPTTATRPLDGRARAR